MKHQPNPHGRPKKPTVQTSQAQKGSQVLRPRSAHPIDVFLRDLVRLYGERNGGS